MKPLILVALAMLLFLTGCSTKSRYKYAPTTTGSTTPPPQEVMKKKYSHPTMRPYQVFGKWYTPTTVSVGEEYEGIASWYGPKFHGKLTSNGETYDMHKKTAAHKTFPMNTIVKVVNKNNGKSTVVRINDRGPFVGDRIIDLSNASAKEIDMVGAGTAPVHLTILGFDGQIETLSAPNRTIELDDFDVQIGAFRLQEGAQRYAKAHENYKGRYKSIVKKGQHQGAPIYRVWLSGFESEQEARDFIDSREFEGSFIIRGH
ncbi:MAG: septal ring lytic transglycosylase RlpA family protein [Campylobacterales bacterium]